MSAERIREAAKVLRDAAENATPGPWEATDDGRVSAGHIKSGRQIGQLRLVVNDTYGACYAGQPATDRDAAYIALMQPSVALALADWLDAIEVLWSGREFLHDDDGDPLKFDESLDSHALTLANTILGDRA